MYSLGLATIYGMCSETKIAGAATVDAIGVLDTQPDSSVNKAIQMQNNFVCFIHPPDKSSIASLCLPILIRDVNDDLSYFSPK